MTKNREHYYIPTLKQQLTDGKIDRREFLRYSTLLGLSVTAAYQVVDKLGGVDIIPAAQAAELPTGGTIRIGMRCPEIKDPHTFSWVYDSNIVRQVCEYLTLTDYDNITHPYLLEKWEASDDLKTWTLYVRQGVKWHNGRDFTADDVVWNMNHVLEPKTGSSVVGLMKGYMLVEVDTGQKDNQGNAVMSTRLWDANAIEKVDDHTVRLNLKEPQVAVPEHLFHYPFLILDPEEKGQFGQGSNGTGAFELVDYRIGVKGVLKARKDYWGTGPYVDQLEFVDLGDDPSANVAALASSQIHGVYEADISQIDIFKSIPDTTIYQVNTAQTAVARVHVDLDQFKDPRVRKALKLAIDPARVLEIAHRNLGAPGEHHHVAQVHPDYDKLPPMGRDVEQAKKLLADAGVKSLDIEIACKKDPAWELAAVQAMVEQWKDANINVKINVMPSNQYWDVWTKVPFGFTTWTHRPLGFMVLALAYRTGVPWNESNYSNPEFDKLLAQAEGILDVDKRRKVLGELEKIMQEDGPITQPLWRAMYVPYNNKVKGFRMHPTSYIFGNEIAIES